MKKIRFIINPISGINRNPQKIVHWIEATFKTSGMEVQIVYTRAPGDGTRLAKETVKLGFDLAVVVGGDGTINEVGRGLFHSKVTLGVIPAGSGNGFARNFKIPLDQQKALKLLLSPKIISIDVGKINKHYFFNVAGIGLDAEISKNFEEFGVRGPLPYFLVGTKAFLTYQPDMLKLIIDEHQFEFSPLLVSIANAPEYGNGAIIAPDARPDDGLLDVTILDYMPIWKVAPNLYRLFNGTIDQMEGYHSYRAKSFTIERQSAGVIHTDGNPHQEEATLKIGLLPRALQVVVAHGYNL